MLVQESVQGKDSAFAIIVGLKHEDEIFESHDARKGPDHERQAANDIGLRRRHLSVRKENLIQRIKRRGPNIAENDT